MISLMTYNQVFSYFRILTLKTIFSISVSCIFERFCKKNQEYLLPRVLFQAYLQSIHTRKELLNGASINYVIKYCNFLKPLMMTLFNEDFPKIATLFLKQNFWFLRNIYTLFSTFFHKDLFSMKLAKKYLDSLAVNRI